MRARLAEVPEVAIGLLLWGGSYVWGAMVGAMLVLAPLLVANMIVEIVEAVPTTAALAAGVASAYAIGLTPWDGESRIGLLVCILASLVSVAIWQVMRGSTDLSTYLVAGGVALAGWPVRRLMYLRERRNMGGPSGA